MGFLESRQIVRIMGKQGKVDRGYMMVYQNGLGIFPCGACCPPLHEAPHGAKIQALKNITKVPHLSLHSLSAFRALSDLFCAILNSRYGV